MKPTLLFACAIAPVALFAQPNITQLNIPVIGDVATIGRCSDPIDTVALNASTGAMQTWDFSGLTEFAEEEILFVDPASTPYVADFPNSGLCGITWDNAYTYYVVSSSELQSEGSTILIGPPPEDTAKYLMNVDLERVIELPYTYGDQFSDTYSGTFSAAGFVGTMNGTVELEADGYGTLILPTGTYTNAVRYRMDRVQNNTIFGNTTVNTSKQWAWVSSDHRFWLLLIDIDFDGFGFSEQVWYDKDPIFVGSSAVNEHGLENVRIHPSPAAQGTAVTIVGITNTSGLRAEVIDALGRSVLVTSAGETTIATGHLVAGTYLVRLSTASGTEMRSTRLVIQ
ncbi:MAG TPA: T9SS type A sorting domain-containing protein [Flavobacteriales bacterium]|nr:T9SS type A sorting domain-containing protein [Flavobacteriales bacterium]HMR26136.1 T9SS type A sorting domain-containing protein [Flavobacteriales bacterium]